MVVEVGGVKVEFKRIHNPHSVGATFTRPDGTKSYGEYRSVKEALNEVRAIQKEKT